MPPEQIAIKNRLNWNRVLHETEQMNAAHSLQFDETLLSRIRKLGYPRDACLTIRDACIDFVKTHSAIVMTFNASYIKKGLTTYQVLHLNEEGSHDRYGSGGDWSKGYAHKQPWQRVRTETCCA